MFQKRPVFRRGAAVAAMSACCAAAVACSSAATDPLANMTGKKVATEAVTNAKAASSLTLTGAVSESGQSYTVNLGIKPGKGCAGTVGEGSKGSFKLVVVDSTVYMQPDNRFWKTTAGSQAAKAIQLFNGKYLKAPAAKSALSGVSQICDVSQLFGPDTTAGTIAKQELTTVGGVTVLPLKASDGSVAYVTDTSKPELVQITAPKSSKNGSGKVMVGINSPVTLTAPPAKQVVDAAKLGM